MRNPLQGFFQMGVRGVGIIAQRIDNPKLEALQMRPGIFRDVGDIGQIHHIADAKSQSGDCAMGHFKGDEV